MGLPLMDCGIDDEKFLGYAALRSE